MLPRKYKRLLRPNLGARLLARPTAGIVTPDKAMDSYASAAYFAFGFSPITALAIAIMGWLPLPIAVVLMVLPSSLLGAGLGVRFPRYGRLALRGLGIGLVAVFLYDCMRVPFIVLGIWGDFIPNIGMWLLRTSRPDWLAGYLYRYLGDGGGMGVAFCVGCCLVGPRVNRRGWAVLYGIGIWLCLMLTLLLAPRGEAMMFKLTPTTFCLSLLGHIIYGAAIGELLTPRNRLARLATGVRSVLDRVGAPRAVPISAPAPGR